MKHTIAFSFFFLGSTSFAVEAAVERQQPQPQPQQPLLRKGSAYLSEDGPWFTRLLQQETSMAGEGPSLAPTLTPAPTPKPTETAPAPIPCGGPCDDRDLCTIDTCDVATNTCQFTPLACGVNKACDAFTGQCADIQSVVPCVAVIDEWDGRDYTNEWAQFRAAYPRRPFCLLVPDMRTNGPFPTGFLNDTVGNVDGVDRTIYEWVNRDGGDTDLVSDWFNLCGLSRFTPASIEFIGLFVDTSGSMALDTVRASYDKFLVDLANAGLAFVPVFNGFERWVDPFLTELVPSLE